MKNTFRYLPFIAIFALMAISASAQDTNKVEFFAGYQYLSVDTGFDEIDSDLDGRSGMHGFNASITGNVHKRFGLKFDFSTHSKNIFEDSDITVKLRTSQYLGGIQIKNNESDGPRVKPFAHVLAGVASQKLSCSGFCSVSDSEGVSSSFSESENSFAMVFGGGLDVKVHKRVDIRVFQIDYNPIWFKGNDTLELDSRTQNNFRIGFGVVIH
jgi:opacity protein-like surface antigen